MAYGSRPELDRLRELGLTEGDLADAVLAGYLQASTCTDHHPRSAPGWLAWCEIVRKLRDIHVPLGWTVSNAQGYETVVSPDRRIAIAVAAGDSDTGVPPPASPRTRTTKGPLTRAALIRKRYYRSFAEISPDFAATAPQLGPTTFILLHHADRNRDEIRAELSTPAEMDDANYVIGWDERNILLPLVARFNLPPDDPDDLDAIDIDVPPRG